MKINIRMLFSPVFTGVLFVAFIIAMAVATFIENDFGAASARQMIYNSRWFELIFLLMVVNLAGQIFTFKLYRKKKLTVMMFHLAFIIMIAGAAITRYTGYEGRVHIREGQAVSYGLSTDKYMSVSILDNSGEELMSHSERVMVTSTSLGSFYKDGEIGNTPFSVRYSRYIPNASESVVDTQDGVPIIALLVTRGTRFREVIYLAEGQSRSFGDFKIGFADDTNPDVSITLQDGLFKVISKDGLNRMSMMTRETEAIAAGEEADFEEMIIYSTPSYRIVPQKLSVSGRIMPVSVERQNSVEGKDAFELEVRWGSEMEKLYVYDIYSGSIDSTETTFGDKRFVLTYGPKKIDLPFTIMLKDFILERYPGSSSPSGYRSEVVLIDKDNDVNMPYSIYMNHILKYHGYRFYQSSYDPDEKGTILSVNSDRAGMLVTYTGYAVLFIFIVLSLINKNSLFRKVKPSMWRNSASKLLGMLILFLSLSTIAEANPVKIVYDKDKADEFGKVLVQDQKGRTKPIFTISNDILRKISRKKSYGEYSPMQVFMGLSTDFQNWQDEPLIKISNKDLRKTLGITREYTSINRLVDFERGEYVLSGMIQEVVNKPAGERDKMDKEIIKVDERVNIIMMVARGEFFRIFPLRDGTDNWGTPSQAVKNALNHDDSLYISNILSLYTNALMEGSRTGNFAQADEYLESLLTYQRKFASYDLPSEAKVKAEIFYYKSLIFERLFPYYATVGIVMLILLISAIIRGRSKRSPLIKVFNWLILLGFLFHTLGLGVRWYISGHSPMSNGYESLIFISWVTVLAGLFFSRRSSLTLAATAVLASLTLMVAHLSFMDPEITNLVPVLQSYWLTLHVSVITASYGFLGLGAILGLVVMILYSLNNNRNRKQILKTVDDLSVINYRSLTLGLYFLTIGTFLGAVWANESWGRYWGWDPKETWSLITIIVYAFVLHSKNIKSLNSIFAFNIMSVYAFSSVLMTYFGVNYYLSGLHSYAGGDSVPIPSFVYISIVVLMILSFYSYSRYNKMVRTLTD
ncbi:MAG: c-type cytochrome biogenesis protein CcsB [Bacteroidales bacterium]|nr:c-type cytochrome biogenesis protein CcsB [Bacteroidales bacterium]